MITAQELQDRWARHSAETAKANSLNKAIVFGALSAAGVSHVVIGFDGEGDSGQIDGAAAFNGDVNVEFPTTNLSIYFAESGAEELATRETNLRDAVEELCYGFLEQEYGGWENNDGAFGEFRFEVAERTIELDFNSRYTDHTHSSHTF